MINLVESLKSLELQISGREDGPDRLAWHVLRRVSIRRFYICECLLLGLAATLPWLGLADIAVVAVGAAVSIAVFRFIFVELKALSEVMRLDAFDNPVYPKGWGSDYLGPFRRTSGTDRHLAQEIRRFNKKVQATREFVERTEKIGMTKELRVDMETELDRLREDRARLEDALHVYDVLKDLPRFGSKAFPLNGQ